jgi:protein-S-isoprenylcysteine O-methyltransferase Ste14
MHIPAGIRTAVYVTGFVLLWGWLALGLRQYDAATHIVMPAWAVSLGVVLTVIGAAVGLSCVFLFATRGRGTPAPFDAPREFVAAGPYRYVRNPMYIGGLLVLGGLGLALRSPAILLLALGAAVLVHYFVVIVEEPGLERRFGDSYRTYKRSVNRWLPRRPRTTGR